MRTNYRYDEFINELLPKLILSEQILVPANSPYYAALTEIPQKLNPSGVIVRATGTATELNPDQDCTVVSNSPTTNFNDIDDAGGIQLRIGHASFFNAISRCFIRFPLSGTPTNPASVKLRLHVFANSHLNNASFGIFRVTSTWTESGPTWNSQPTIDAIPQAQFSTGLMTSGVVKLIEVDVTALYNAWKAGNNYGLAIRADESLTGTLKQICSRSHATAAYRPQLTITPAGQQLVELPSVTQEPGPGQFTISYSTGRVRFHSSAAGQTYEVDYRGLGSGIDVEDVMRQAAPATSGAKGTPGQLAFDGTYLYVCVATNTWRRISHSSF